jgi:hypothetical protein
MELIHVSQERHGYGQVFAVQPLPVRILAYTVMILSIVLLGNFMAKQFIYFQF